MRHRFEDYQILGAGEQNGYLTCLARDSSGDYFLFKWKQAKGDINVYPRRLVRKEYYSRTAGEIGGIRDARMQAICTSHRQQFRQLVEAEQDHGVNVNSRPRLSNQANCNASDYDPTIAECLEDALNRLKALEERLLIIL